MPSLPTELLFAKLRAALPNGTAFRTPQNEIHPAECTIPGFGYARFYLFTVTPDRSSIGARPPGEYKIQLIVSGQDRRKRGGLNISRAYTTLLGYSPDFGVFVAWEAGLYVDFAYSANLQVREPLLIEARDNGWAVGSPRPLKDSTEVRVAFNPGELSHFLRTSREADSKALKGQWREAHFLSKTPRHHAGRIPTRLSKLETYLLDERKRLNTTRLARNAKFSPLVKEQYQHSCAVCSLQLEIIQSAHIIPVNNQRGVDEIWNGIALCPNHHSLFDAKRFVVTPRLRVSVDFQAIKFLEESGRASGFETLSDYHNAEIRRPFFWKGQAELRERMKEAFLYTSSLAAID